MALKARENINGTTPQDLNKLNTNFQHVWKTLFGGIDFSSTNNDLKKRIQTQTIPVQGEGNFDKNFPLYIRFYVPSNVKEITTSSFNLICERYRMDSGVAMDGGSVVDAPISMSLASASTAVASVSSVSNTSEAGGQTSTYADMWGNWNPGDPTGSAMDLVAVPASFNLFCVVAEDNSVAQAIYNGVPYGWADGELVNYPYRFAPIYKNSSGQYWLDLATVQHKHSISGHSHKIPAHSHSITIEPHTHSASANISIPSHTHDLKEGIQISKVDATDVSITLNGNVIASMNSTASNVKNDLDVTKFINIGAWNVIECSTLSLARITLYGIIELVMKY